MATLLEYPCAKVANVADVAWVQGNTKSPDLSVGAHHTTSGVPVGLPPALSGASLLDVDHVLSVRLDGQGPVGIP